jgi:hypothetical protein
MLRKILRFVLSILIFVGMYYFCGSQTKGFRFQEILSDIPNNPRWEITPLSLEDQKVVGVRLNQTFRYLGSGEQSHAFLGEDQKTVLKFFRHNDLSFLKILHKFPGSINNWLWHLMKKYDPYEALDSCKFAYDDLAEQTGLFFIHINKTQGQFNKVVLMDNIGVSHQVDLDTTEFMVQEYCELAVSRIDACMKREDINSAMGSVRALFTAIEEWSRLGVHIDNPILKRNIGFCGEKVIMLDVGSLKKAVPLETDGQIKKEIKRVTRGLGHWINKRHPELYPYFEQELKR